MTDDRDYLPASGNGRAAGRALDWFGVAVERLGIWIQAQAAEIRWRRARAWRRWGS